MRNYGVRYILLRGTTRKKKVPSLAEPLSQVMSLQKLARQAWWFLEQCTVFFGDNAGRL